jgi:hypothetical protein
MRRIVGIVTFGLLFTLLGSTVAQADGFKVYRGHLNDGHDIGAVLERGPAGNVRLRTIFFEITLTCEDAPSQEWGLGFGFFRGPVLVDRMLALDFVDPDLAVHVHGYFGSRHASGDLAVTIPALTEDEQAQLCTTGDLTWTMRRRATAASDGSAPRDLDGRIHVRIGRDGTDPVVRVRAA